MTDYTVFLDLAKLVQPIDKGILSRTLFSDDRLKAVAFGFAQGEELSEHTASMPGVLHFLRHVKNLLAMNGWCAIVVPDNVLFEGGAGERVRRKLLEQCDVHTLLRLPTGLFYAQGVKANVLFFDAKPTQEKAWTSKLGVYDLRTNMHFTLKTKPLKRADLDEFVDVFRPAKRHLRKPTWSEENPGGRWRCYSYDDMAKRDKLNLDLFWLKDESLEDSESLPEPDELAEEIVEDLQTALELFGTIAKGLKG
jgi:type I restriction enzyme M protein